MPLAQLRKRLKSVNVRQREVEQHQFEVGARIRSGERFGAIPRFDQIEPAIESAKHMTQRFAYQRMIVDDQDFQAVPPSGNAHAERLHA